MEKSQDILKQRITRKMPRAELENHISEFLKSQNMCVLATCRGDTPRATPIEYYSKGTTLYMIAEEGTKLRNIEANPQVSIGIFAPYNGWLSVKGAQITGVAKIITRTDGTEFSEGLSVYQWQRSVQELGLSELPEGVKLLRVRALSIEMVDISLKTRGYSAMQEWKA